MAALTRSLKTITFWGLGILFRIEKILIGIMVAGLGVVLGSLLNSSAETSQLTVSILAVFLLMLVTIAKPLNGLLALLVFTAFVQYWINIPMGAGIPDLSFDRFVIAFLFIFMLARAAIGKFQFVNPLSRTDIAIVAATLGIMAAAPLSDDPISVIQEGITRYFVPLTMYFFAKNLVRDREDLNKLLLAMTIFGFLAAVYAMYEHWTGHILFVSADKVGNLYTAYTENLRMLRGLLGRGGNFGRIFTSTIPVTFFLFFEYKTATRKILLAGALAAQAFGIFIAYSRTPWYALLIGLSILQFFYPQFRKLFYAIAFVAIVVLWATWDQVNESAVVEERVNEKTENFNGRTPRWQAGFNMWKAKPIRGWGFGQYEQVSGRFRSDGFTNNFKAIENDYLDIMVNCGLVGLLPYVFFLLMPLINSIRLFFRARAPDWTGFVPPEAIAVYWCTIIAFAVCSYTQVQTEPLVKMIPFALAGAVVGTHEHWLGGAETKTRLALAVTSSEKE